MVAALLSVEILCSIFKHYFFNGGDGPPYDRWPCIERLGRQRRHILHSVPLGGDGRDIRARSLLLLHA